VGELSAPIPITAVKARSHMLDVVVVRSKGLSAGASSIAAPEYTFPHHIVEVFRNGGHGCELDCIWNIFASPPGAAPGTLYGRIGVLRRHSWEIQPTSIRVTDELLAFAW